MNAAVIAALVWVVAGNLAAMLPSRRNHWPLAWLLIASGAPLATWLFLAAGPWPGLLFLAAAASVLRWPLRRALRGLALALRPLPAKGPREE